MFGALRLVSVQQGYDPRDFALVAFGGAGPLHANALAQLLGLLAGDHPAVARACSAPTATPRRALRNEASRTFIRRVLRRPRRGGARELDELAAESASGRSTPRACPRPTRRSTTRPTSGTTARASRCPVDVDLTASTARRRPRGRRQRGSTRAHRGSSPSPWTPSTRSSTCGRSCRAWRRRLDARRLTERRHRTRRPPGSASTTVWVDGGRRRRVALRPGALQAGNVFPGPAIVTEMDSTTLVLPGHVGTVDRLGQPAHPPDAGWSTGTRSRVRHGHARRDQRRAPFDRVDVDPVRSTSSRTRCATPATRWTPCCSGPRCRPGIREQHDEFPLIADRQGRMVVGQFGSFIHGFLAGLRRHGRGGRRLLHLRPLRLRRRDQPRQRLAGAAADLPRGPAGRLGGDVRPHDRRRRQGARQPAHRRDDRSSRRACIVPPFKLYSRASSTSELLDTDPEPGPAAGLEPGRPQRDRGRLPHRRARGSSSCATGSAPRPTSPRWTRCWSATAGRWRSSSARPSPEETLTFEDYVYDDGRGFGPYKIRCTM